jgi:sugar phosphate isomerase/epimerase
MIADRPGILLGTVAIEPNRWGQLDAHKRATINVVEHLERITEAGFDGIEIWEDHFVEANEADRAALRGHVEVYNSYVSLDDPDPAERCAVAALAAQTAATGIKFNVGNNLAAESDYIDRIAAWLDQLSERQRLMCECHAGISLAEDPATAARIFDAAGPASRLQAIAHTHDGAELLRKKFDAYGDRITHIHVNYLPDSPPLRDHAKEVESTVALVGSLGFNGTYTIEFSNGVLDIEATPSELLTNAIDDLTALSEVLH